MAKAIMAVKFAGEGEGEAAVEHLIGSCRGEVVARTGDGVIAEFRKPAKALECAQRINEAEGGAAHRVGIHIGEAKAGAAATAVRLAALSAAGGAAISREVEDAVRRIRGAATTSIGPQPVGGGETLEVLHVWRPGRGQSVGGHSKLLAPFLALVVSIILIGGYAIWKQPMILDMTLGIKTAPTGLGPGAEGGPRPSFQKAPGQ